MVLAPLAARSQAPLRELLASMNRAPGHADPANPILPFGRFERLHMARLLVLEAPTPLDIGMHDVPPRPFEPSLVFLGDCDGPAETLLEEMTQAAAPGLRRIFSHCRDFDDDTDLLAWMRAHEQRPSASYVNWIGRTVRQVREEHALQQALRQRLEAEPPSAAEADPLLLHERLLSFVQAERAAGRLTLSAPEPTPRSWRRRNLAHRIGVPLAALALAPLLLLASPVLAFMLRRREKTDPDYAPTPDPAHRRATAALEDHDVTNAFTVFGDLKPGRFRRWTTQALLVLLDYASRHIYGRGYLTRVQTIHFARWVFLDDRRRLFFASNYDGSLDSYMDDFINKVAWGINLVFSNGVGYPRSNWLIGGGAHDERKYKRVLHRHQLVTDVWYKAYPGLTALDLQRNSAIRRGVERTDMSDREAREWLALL